MLNALHTTQVQKLLLPISVVVELFWGWTKCVMVLLIVTLVMTNCLCIARVSLFVYAHYFICSNYVYCRPVLVSILRRLSIFKRMCVQS